MKKGKMLRRLAAMLLVGTTMVGMGTSVFAEEPMNAIITKEITKDADDYAPATTFEFSITPGTAVDAVIDNQGNITQEAIYAGPADGAYFAGGAGAITSVPNANDIGKTTITVGTTTISIDGSKFAAPGIYRYNVSEVIPEAKYEGITYSTETKFFDVYVNSNKAVYAYTFTDAAAQNGKDNGVFTNDYSSIYDLIITKNVTGNQGDKSKDFDFPIQVTGAENEKFYVTFSDDRTPITLTNGSQTIKLKDGQSATIHGLSMTDTYSVDEADYTKDGYTTTVEGAKKGQISADTTVVFTNHKQVTTPTGIVMNIAPYVLMVAVAVVLAVVFLRKRNNFEN